VPGRALATQSSRGRANQGKSFSLLYSCQVSLPRRDVIIPSLIPFNPALRSTLLPPPAEVPETNCRTNNERNKIDELTTSAGSRRWSADCHSAVEETRWLIVMVPLSEFRASDCHAACVRYYQIGEAKIRIEDFIIGTIHRIHL
jgi:hypothetical protein